MNNTDHADTQQDRTAGITRDAIDEAREQKTHATALVAAIVAAKAALDGSDNWPALAATIDRCWATQEWAHFANQAHVPTPSYQVRDMATAMLAQVDSDGAPTGDQMFDMHIDRRRGHDVAAALVADHARHGAYDWVHLADWLDANFTALQWGNLARVHGMRFTITPDIAAEATRTLRTIDLHGAPTVDELVAHDHGRRNQRPTLTQVPA